MSKSFYYDPLKAKRRRHLAFKIAFLFLAVVALIGALSFILFFKGFFDVRAIDIEGAETINKEEIIVLVNSVLDQNVLLSLPYKINVLLTPKDKITSLIKERFPKIESADVKKHLFHKLTVKIEERETAGLWCVNENDCWYFDAGGIAFERAPHSKGILILRIDDLRVREFEMLDKVENDLWVAKILTAKKFLAEKLDLKISSISIPDGSFDEFDIITSEGWKLILSNQLDIKSQIDSLKIFLEGKFPQANKRASLQYIDARIPDRFYYR